MPSSRTRAWMRSAAIRTSRLGSLVNDTCSVALMEGSLETDDLVSGAWNIRKGSDAVNAIIWCDIIPSRAERKRIWRPKMSVIDERGKRVITEREVRVAGAGDTIRITDSALLTPLAADLAAERGVIIERVARR